MHTVLLVLGGIVVAIIFSLLLAYSLRRQNLHAQVEILRKVVRRSRSPWVKEDQGWKALGEAVKGIPDDLRPPSKDA
ncbi:MAG TPA: hypothetical protein ENJ54_02135 [Chloroflexi bacterium]|nr:hypothetical protein [Chloroflexota bacterium]